MKRACELLRVRRQGYYEWRGRSESNRKDQDEALRREIQNIFFESNRIYGARKIRSELKRKGITTSRKRIRRLMTEAGLCPVTHRKRVNTTDSQHNLTVYPNLLYSNTANDINRIWVSDFTYIPTEEGWLYLCSLMDLYSRRVVGWAVSSVIDRHLAIAAFNNAINNRHPGKLFIFHSDRGSQYASNDFRNALNAAGGVQSMSSPGNPYENACAESFFKTLKVECVDRFSFKSRAQAGDAVSTYMLWYNRKRIHASLDYRSPLEFEQHLSSLAS